MTTGDLLLAAPAVITELGAEFLRRGDECMIADPKSQLLCLALPYAEVLTQVQADVNYGLFCLAPMDNHET